MTHDEFWKIIEDTGNGSEPYEQAEAIRAELERRSPEEIVEFERISCELQALSYTWDLWGAAYLINGGCSDDGFDYFRGWLLTQGKAAFEAALANPDSLADFPNLEEEVECEDILNVSFSAYQKVAAADLPSIPINFPELGEDWDFDSDEEMKTRYPKLFAKFCE